MRNSKRGDGVVVAPSATQHSHPSHIEMSPRLIGIIAVAVSGSRPASRVSCSHSIANHIKHQTAAGQLGRVALISTCFISCLILVSQQPTQTQALANSDSSLNGDHEQPQDIKTLNYLLYQNTRTRAKTSQKKPAQEAALEELLKDAHHDHMSHRVNISLANDIWRRWHQNALEFAQDSTRQVRPAVNRLLDEAKVRQECRRSLNDFLDHLASLNDWAVKMYNAFGDFPATGLFEGTFTSMGSYSQCVDVVPNELIERPQYCTFRFQPVLPKRPRYHNILATIDQLANFTNKDDMFHGIAKKAHYFFYTRLHLATCLPSKCDQADLDAIGQQIAVNTYLQFQGHQCLEKEAGFNPDGAQVFALVVLGALASVALLGTLVHLLDVRSWFEPGHERVSPFAKNYPGSLPIELTTAAHLKAASAEPFLACAENNNNSQLNHQVSRKVGPTLLPSPASMSDKQSRYHKAALHVIDVLMHFSVVKNGRKLFDTSTSRGRGNSRAGSLVPGLHEPAARATVANGCAHVADAAGGGADLTAAAIRSQSESSSIDGQSNDISCVHGLRFWTISWIILGHTMQYFEWAAFSRTHIVEKSITSFALHPLLNATFSVDTFFLISGLLTTYVTWTITRGHYWRFNKFAFLISRYLRLMPQVLIVILIFIIFPMLGDGPYWRGTVQKESERCKANWWVSALFIQSFYKSDQICNLVTWWLSIEMFFHFTSIVVIIALLHSARKGILATLLLGGGMTVYSCYLHYSNHYPPNMLPTLLQRYEIWDSIVLKYFWTPYPHAPSYFVGLLLGYALYNRSVHQLTKRQVRAGWSFFAISYLMILFGTYWWNKNAPYSRFMSTAYYNLSQVFWALATGWAILACALGNGGWLNEFLSSPVFIPLGRATYMTYLSHMLVVMAYPAKLSFLIEPSYTVFLYIFISNLVLSYALGICLTLVYESPILHLQKLLVARMASKFNEERAPSSGGSSSCRNKRRSMKRPICDDEKAVRVSLYTQPLTATNANTAQQQPIPDTHCD